MFWGGGGEKGRVRVEEVELVHRCGEDYVSRKHTIP